MARGLKTVHLMNKGGKTHIELRLHAASSLSSRPYVGGKGLAL